MKQYATNIFKVSLRDRVRAGRCWCSFDECLFGLNFPVGLSMYGMKESWPSAYALMLPAPLLRMIRSVQPVCSSQWTYLDFRGGSHFYPGLNRPDRRLGSLWSHLLPRGEESGGISEHFGADCVGNRMIRADTGRRFGPSADRDCVGAGHVVADLARGHTVAQSNTFAQSIKWSSERVHLATSLGGLRADGRTEICALHSGRHDVQSA